MSPRAQEFQLVESPGWASEPALDEADVGAQHRIRVYYTDDRNASLDIYVTTFYGSVATSPPDPTANQAPVFAGPLDEHSPSVQPSAAAGGLLVWTVDDPATGPDLWMQRYYSNGLPRGSPTVLVIDPGAQDKPNVVLWSTTDGQPQFLVDWQDDRLGTFDVLGGMVAATGRLSRQRRALAGD